MLLQEINRTTSVNATAKSGEFTYNVNYNIENNKLSRLFCEVYQTVSQPVQVPGNETQNIEQPVNIGYIVNESGNKQVVLREDVDIIPHLEMFEEILAEVKSSLSKK